MKVFYSRISSNDGSQNDERQLQNLKEFDYVHYELNYPNNRQTFFRSVANDLEKDKRNILKAINELHSE